MLAARASGSFSNSNFGEWTPMTTSSWSHFSSNGRSSSSTCRQFTQQKVQKSSSTILPRRSSRSRSTPPVFSQPRPRSADPRARAVRGWAASAEELMGPSEHCVGEWGPVRVTCAGIRGAPGGRGWRPVAGRSPRSPGRDPGRETRVQQGVQDQLGGRDGGCRRGHGDQGQSGLAGGAGAGAGVLESEGVGGVVAQGASSGGVHVGRGLGPFDGVGGLQHRQVLAQDRKSTRLNSSHVANSYADFCLKKKTK